MKITLRVTVIAFLFALLGVITLLVAQNDMQIRTLSTLPAVSDGASVTSTPHAGTSVGAASSSTDCSTAVDYGFDMSEDGPDMKPYTSPDSTPGVPIYPGAELKSENCHRSCVSGCLSYYLASGGELSKIKAFYDDALPKRGWEFIYKSDPNAQFFYENYYKNNSPYMWKNPSISGPSMIFLVVGFTELGEGIQISVRMSAWADAKNPPLHPQAKQVETKWTKDQQYGFPEWTVSYTVDLGKSEVIDYYKKAMKQQGWCANVKDSTDSEFLYFFELPAPVGIGGATVSIASADSGSENTKDGGSTRVLITTNADDFQPEDVQEGK